MPFGGLRGPSWLAIARPRLRGLSLGPLLRCWCMSEYSLLTVVAMNHVESEEASSGTKMYLVPVSPLPTDIYFLISSNFNSCLVLILSIQKLLPIPHKCGNMADLVFSHPMMNSTIKEVLTQISRSSGYDDLCHSCSAGLWRI